MQKQPRTPNSSVPRQRPVGALKNFSPSRDLFPPAASQEAPEVTDVDLIRQVLAGSEEAFEAVVDRYQQKAFWIAFHVLGRVEEARDVTQEAFVRVFRSLHRFDFARNFYTWFYRIVMNLAIDHMRKLQTAKAANLEDFGQFLEGGEDATEPTYRNETRDLVWQTLARLDGKFKSVLVLRDIHGMSCREIAPILKVTHATVRWRLHRGRQIFKEHWDRVARNWK